MTGAWRRTILLLSCHFGSQRWFSGCLLQWLMSYFIFFSDYREKMEHGRGALQLLNPFLFLESADFFPFVHIFWCAYSTTFSALFYETMISTQGYWDKNEAWVFCSLALWSLREQRNYIFSLETQAILFSWKGARMRKSRHFLLSLLSSSSSSLSVSMVVWYKARDEASDRKKEMVIQYKAHGGMPESERWKTKRAVSEETTGWES